MSQQAKDYPYLQRDYPLAIAHRGGAGDWPENSSQAFESAYALGFRYMETDVHLTADGKVVAFHDPTLERLGGSAQLISDLPWSAIKGLRLSDGGAVPLLADLFEQLPDAYFNIDMKCDEVVMPLLDLIAEQAAQSRVCLASFVDKRVSRVRSKWGRQTCLSAGKRAVTLQLVRSRGLPWPAPHAPVIQVPVRQLGVEIVTPRFVQKCHNDGKHVHVWTINEPTEMERLLRLGVDGIVTDHPERLRKVMEKLGVWV